MSVAAGTQEVVVPDIGDFADVPVIEILVAVGDTVAVEDPLVALESDKATMEIPAPAAGTVTELLVAVGDTVSVGSPLLRLQLDGAPPEAAADAPQDPADAPEPVVEQAPAASPQPAAEPEPVPAQASSDAALYASPAVRRLARERGVDLAAARGTGRRGRITKADVATLADGAATPAAADAAGLLASLPSWPKVDFARYGEIERVALSRVKRLSGPNIARNWVAIPHVTHHDEADVTDLEAFRKQVNAEQPVKVTMVALLMKACVASLRAFPDVNSSLDGDALVLKRYFHLGFATDTPQGLLVPVIRDADRKGLLEIAAELTALSGRAREGKLSAEEMRGSTFTISSLGGIGGTAFTPIINAPEVAILGVTRSHMRPVWDGSAFVPRLMIGLSLSYDHRVIDGAAAARFVAHLGGVLTDLKRVLL